MSSAQQTPDEYTDEDHQERKKQSSRDAQLKYRERCQERKARESLEASIAESQEPKIDAIAPEDGKQSIRSTVPPRDMNSSKLLDGEKTQAKEGTGSGLPWGNVEIVNVSIVRRSMG